MREIIQKLVATETEAKRLVQAARAEAEQLVANTRLPARQVGEQANREATFEAEKILAAAEAEAAREKTERLVRATAEINANLRLDETTAQRLVEAALHCVCGLPDGAPVCGPARAKSP